MGPLLKIRVGHDGKGAFAGWCLDKVNITILSPMLIYSKTYVVYV